MKTLANDLIDGTLFLVFIGLIILIVWVGL